MTLPKNQAVSKRLLATTTALTLMAVLAGCSSDNEEDQDNTVETSDAETEYIPASADGPAQNVPEPNLPAVATENTEEGAEASFNYFWESEEYARLTGNTDLLRIVSSDECAFCAESIQGWTESYEDGEWTAIQGELRTEITDIQTAVDEELDKPVAHIYFNLHEPATDFYDPEGRRTDNSFDAPEIKNWFALLYFDATSQRWEIEWLGLEESITWEG